MFNTSQLTGSRNGHARPPPPCTSSISNDTISAIVFYQQQRNVHSQISDAISQRFCSASVSGLLLSGSTLIFCTAGKARRDLKARCASAAAPVSGAHTAQSHPGRGGGGTHVSMAIGFSAAFVIFSHSPLLFSSACFASLSLNRRLKFFLILLLLQSFRVCLSLSLSLRSLVFSFGVASFVGNRTRLV